MSHDELTKSIEEMTDEEKDALVERVSTMEFWDENDRAFEAGRALRQRVIERPDLRTFAREDVVAVLNFTEAVRISSHVVITLAADNLKRMHRALSSGKCAYCDWVYRDALLDVRADDPIPDEEIAAMHERVTAEIRQHVKSCLAHPMRQLERVTETFEEALRFYAAADHWQSRSTGFEAQYDPAPAAAVVDNGRLARLALTGGAKPADSEQSTIVIIGNEQVIDNGDGTVTRRKLDALTEDQNATKRNGPAVEGGPGELTP